MLEEEGLITSHTGAKSYVSADAGLVERIRGELVEETVRGRRPPCGRWVWTGTRRRRCSGGLGRGQKKGGREAR